MKYASFLQAAIGYLKPIEIKSGLEGTSQIKKRLAQLNVANHVNSPIEEKALINQFYKKKRNSWLKPDSPVYLSFSKGQGQAILKEQTPKRGALFFIDKPNNLQDIIMFTLKNSQGRPLHGLYYQSDLSKAPDKVDSNYPLKKTIAQRVNKKHKHQVELQGKRKQNISNYVNISDLLAK